jgi:hypothetical protein
MPTVPQLRKHAHSLGIKTTGLRKHELAAAIIVKLEPERATKQTGRPTALTQEVHDDYLVALLRGGNPTDCAGYAGIHPASVRNWQARLEMADPQVDANTGELVTWADDEHEPSIPILFAFFADIKKAEADAKVLRLGQIEAAGRIPRFWTAAAWWLERKFPDEYGRRERRDVAVVARVEHVTSGVVDADEVLPSGVNKLDALVLAAAEIVEMNVRDDDDEGGSDDDDEGT